MTEPQGTSSSWLLDLIAFLRSVFLSFTNLPLKLAQMTCMSACQHLARSMMSMLMNDTVKAISIGVLQQIDLDLCQCEQFAASEPIQGLEVILIHTKRVTKGILPPKCCSGINKHLNL